MDILEYALRLLAIGAFALLLLGCAAKAILMFSVSARTRRLFPELVHDWSAVHTEGLWSPGSTQGVRWWDWASKRPVEPAGDPMIAELLVRLAWVQGTLMPLFMAAITFGVLLRCLR